MIKFFRKIRYNLMEQNKTGKYFKYAIGEILLVIIGILIAVSINGWNEERKLKIEEQAILKDLKQEMETNLEALEIVIEEHEKSFEAAKEMRALFGNRDAFNKMPDSTYASIFRKMNNNYTYDPRNGILNSIISSGQVNIISNKELKYLMASLKEWTVDAFENTMKIENQRDDLLNSTYHNNYIFKDGKIDGWNWKASYDHPPFRTLASILFFFTRRDGLIEEYELKEALKHIIELLENDIEK